MSLPAPVHVNQLTAGGRFPNGSPSGSFDCTVAAGVMAVDAFTAGALRPSTTELRARQRDQSGGIGLDDLAAAFRSYGLTFRHAGTSWATVLDRLGRGDGLVLQGSYAVVPRAYSAQPGFRGGHAVYAQRVSRPGWVTVNDPLAPGPRDWPAALVQRFYVSGLARAGYFVGTYAGDTGGGGGGGMGAYLPPNMTLDQFRAALVAAGISTDDSHRITKDEAARLARVLNWPKAADLATSIVGLIYNSLGKPNSFVPGFTADANANIAGAVDAVGRAATDALGHIALLGGIVALGLVGAYLTVRQPGSVVVNLARRAGARG